MIPYVHLDIETRSKASLTSTAKKVGSDAYSRDPSTDVWCVCWLVEDGFDDEVQVWQPGDPVPEIFKEPYILVAHNYTFEKRIIENVLIPRYGFTPPAEYRCTMAQCAHANLPMALGNVTERLDLTEKKDTSAHDLMIKMANATRYDPAKENSTASKNHNENLSKLIEYCKQDVRSEVYVEKFFTFHPFPRDQFLLDQKINDRGIKIDTQTAAAIEKAIAKETRRLNGDLKSLTGGVVSTGRQTAKLLEWLRSQGYPHLNLSEGCVSDVLKDPQGITMEGLQVLDLRKRLALGSLAKYGVMVRNVDAQDRLHDLFQFCGAAQTGRWAGRLVQIQNLPRKPHNLDDETIETLVEMFRAGDTKEIVASTGHDILTVAKWMIRPMFIAPPGKMLVVSDLAQIECRVLAWLAGQQDILDTFASDGDPYANMAAKIFHKPAAACGKGTRERQLGKAAILGLGFSQGAKGFAENVWDKERIQLTEAESKTIVNVYRDASPRITAFWHGVDMAMRRLVHNPDEATDIGRLRFSREGDCICIRLPSGRQLRYWQPLLETNSDGAEELRFSASTGNRNKLWKGLIVENIVQATARDILTDRMLQLDGIVGHVHDEVILEMAEGVDIQKVGQIMSVNPSWADGLPLAAETDKGKRYTK